MCASCDNALDSGGLPRCLKCRAFVCEDADGSLPALCPECQGSEGQAPVASDAVPVAIPEDPTKRVRTLTDAELLAELEQHAEAGS